MSNKRDRRKWRGAPAVYVGLYLPPEYHNAVKVAAAKENKSMQEYIFGLVEKDTTTLEREKARWRLQKEERNGA